VSEGGTALINLYPGPSPGEAHENGEVYVFRLRQGMKFRAGRDFDAAAVAWNFQRIPRCCSTLSSHHYYPADE
jgi:hypothetical protein